MPAPQPEMEEIEFVFEQDDQILNTIKYVISKFVYW